MNIEPHAVSVQTPLPRKPAPLTQGGSHKAASFSFSWETHLALPLFSLLLCAGLCSALKEDLSCSILGAKRIRGSGGWGCPGALPSLAAGLGVHCK